MGEYQQGYDPKSLWDATLLETLWGMAVALPPPPHGGPLYWDEMTAEGTPIN